MSNNESALFKYEVLESGRQIGYFIPLRKLEGFAHAVSTLNGPAFPVDIHADETLTAKLHNDFAAELNLPTAAWAEQVHEATVLTIDTPGYAGPADAMISNTPGIALTCRSADCPIILAADPVTKTVGIAHASWRSTLDEITYKTITAMTEQFSADPANIIACICPSASPDKFEVGPEVKTLAIEKLGSPAKFFFTPTGDNFHFDLWAANVNQLQRAGVTFMNTYTSRVCTITRDDLFPSFRRDGKSATRFAATIGIL